MNTVLVAFEDTATLCLEPWNAIIIIALVKEARPSLTEEEIQRGYKKRELDELLKQYIQSKGYEVI